MSFLHAFKDVLHAVEASAKIAAPFVAIANPVVGALIMQATASAISVETAITTPGTGKQKAALVAAQTQATVDLINNMLTAQGKPPLPANITDQVVTQVDVIVKGLITTANATDAPQTPAV